MDFNLTGLRLGAVTMAIGSILAGCGGDEKSPKSVAVQTSAAGGQAITEGQLPPGFKRTPAVTIDGKRHRFDKVPGHYWKVLDKRGYAVGLHFQTDKPFPWAKGVPKGELLYMIYAIPGNCGNGSYAKAVASENATIVGKTPPGFDHWHASVGGGSQTGHWLAHTPVRDFTFAGPEGNPDEGKKIVAGTPGFIPVCDIR